MLTDPADSPPQNTNHGGTLSGVGDMKVQEERTHTHHFENAESTPSTQHAMTYIGFFLSSLSLNFEDRHNADTGLPSGYSGHSYSIYAYLKSALTSVRNRDDLVFFMLSLCVSLPSPSILEHLELTIRLHDF